MPYRGRSRRAKKQKTSEDAEDATAQPHSPGLSEPAASPPSTRTRAREQISHSPPHHDDSAHDATTSSPTGSTEAVAAPWNGPLIGYCFCQDWKVTIKEPIPGVVYGLPYATIRVCSIVFGNSRMERNINLTCTSLESRALLMVEPRDREARNVESSTYYYTIKTGDNVGQSQSRTFCKRCGTVLFATPESLEGALPVNRNLFGSPHNDLTPSLRELLTPRIEIFTKDRSPWRPGQDGVLHQYISMPMGFGDSESSQDTAAHISSGDLHL
ncbi:hypothetical protein Dda_6774 [Drechslerella dactyloides]|uniref:CENP-V/GFA domain-containing protein n=1 Tax=Drechslerella dactyloides TaxID=74499 RepID=A0AAD6IU52_DREDA|nr:hypothetical protein Dda_6774 [Drechslerella dactyloides]